MNLKYIIMIPKGALSNDKARSSNKSTYRYGLAVVITLCVTAFIIAYKIIFH